MRFNLWLLLTALALLTPLSAQARTRDDVMSGAFRCAAIGDSRQWLNCYYGAAQPIRAQLGLQPAPPDQINLAVSPPRGGEVSDERIRDEVMSGAFTCNSFADDRGWLDCYYAAAQPMRAQNGLTPAPQARVIPLPNVGVRMGLPLPVASPRADAPSQKAVNVPAQPAHNAAPIASSMASYSFDRDGIFTVTLADGQVWHQHSTDNNYAHWDKRAASYLVTISRGWLGSYSLKVQGAAGEFKVERLK